MGIHDFLSVGGYVLGVAGIFGSASALFFQSRAKTVIELLQDENEALRNSNERLGTENTTLRADKNAANDKVTYLEKLLLGANKNG